MVPARVLIMEPPSTLLNRVPAIALVCRLSLAILSGSSGREFETFSFIPMKFNWAPVLLEMDGPL